MHPGVSVRLNGSRVLLSSAGQGPQARPEELTSSEDQYLEQKLLTAPTIKSATFQTRAGSILSVTATLGSLTAALNHHKPHIIKISFSSLHHHIQPQTMEIKYSQDNSAAAARPSSCYFLSSEKYFA